jgi:hypothetical protein
MYILTLQIRASTLAQQQRNSDALNPCINCIQAEDYFFLKTIELSFSLKGCFLFISSVPFRTQFFVVACHDDKGGDR